jgi:hypothetical protein
MTTSRRLGIAVAALIAGSASVLAAPASASPGATAPANIVAANIVAANIVAANIVAAGPSAAPSARDAVQTCSQTYYPLPDPACQPGSTNPDVSQDNIDDTICVSGWTKTVRPATSYTNRLKVQQIAEYGYHNTDVADYEEDHLIPLGVGGDPSDPGNLWPQPRYGNLNAADKDVVEAELHRAVCDGRAGLVDAQNAIATDWTTALEVLCLEATHND